MKKLSSLRHSASQRQIFIWLPILLLCIVNLLPIWLLFKQAVTPDIESLSWPLRLLPGRITIENFRLFFESKSILNGFYLSLWIGVATTVLSLLIGTLAGFAIARAPSLGSKGIPVLLFTRIFPSISLAIPLAIIFIRLGLYNHPQGLGLVFAHSIFVLPFTTLIAYSTFKTIPRELEEQALVDGCSYLSAFIKITLPLAKPGIAAAFILSFILSWDEFTYSLLLQITNRNLPPLVYYYSVYGNVGIASAISSIMLIPAIGMVFVIQRFVRAGYLSGAVK